MARSPNETDASPGDPVRDAARDTDASPPVVSPGMWIEQWCVQQPVREAHGIVEFSAHDVAGRDARVRVPLDLHVAARLRADAELSKRYADSAVVKTLAVVDLGRWPVQVIEQPDGLLLDELIEAIGALDADTVGRIAVELCEVMQTLHRGRPTVHHGALSPGRIVLSCAGQVLLADLGRVRAKPSKHHTSPERVAGDLPRSADDDIYAVGACLFDAAQGAVGALGAGADPRTLRTVLPAAFADIVIAMLAPAAQRIGTFSDVGERLAAAGVDATTGRSAIARAVARAVQQREAAVRAAQQPITRPVTIDTDPVTVPVGDPVEPPSASPLPPTPSPTRRSSVVPAVVATVALCAVGGGAMWRQLQPLARASAAVPVVMRAPTLPDVVAASSATAPTQDAPVVVISSPAAPRSEPSSTADASAAQRPPPTAHATPAHPAEKSVAVKPTGARADVKITAAASIPAKSTDTKTTVRLTLDVDAATRARIESKLTACVLRGSVLGAVEAGTPTKVSTTPKNACVAHVLSRELQGWNRQDAEPFEIARR